MKIENQTWAIDSNMYEGDYSIKSQKIENDDTATLSIEILVEETNNLSFYYKTETEATYDELKFYIDDSLYVSFSGIFDWKLYNTMVSTGLHTLKWQYIKDFQDSDSHPGCVWLDFIELPKFNATILNGISFTNCIDTILTTEEVFNYTLETSEPNQIYNFQNINLPTWLTAKIATKHFIVRIPPKL
ncbi:MAG: hypothetical protein IPO21_02930 [Bacteroidales bacterium]|nr:hypothetical protein [Bacteroidales bacterium]